MKADVRTKGTPRGRAKLVSAVAPSVPPAMRSAPSLAALDAIRDDYARGLVLVQIAAPKRARKRARNQLDEALRLLLVQVSSATSLADSQVRSIVRDDGVVTIESIAS